MSGEAHLHPEKRFYRGGLIDLSSYSLERCKLSAQWDEWLAASPEGTVFGHSAFLRALDRQVHTYLLRKAARVVALVYLPYAEDRNAAVLDPLLIYNGLVFLAPDPNQNRAQIASDRFAVSAFLTEELANSYNSVELRLSPSIGDVRPMLWHNYGTDGPKFSVDVRYTSVLDIRELAGPVAYDKTEVYLGMSKSRRQELRYARRADYRTRVLKDSKLWVELYRETFSRQGLEVDEAEMARKAKLIDRLVAEGCAKVFATGRDEVPPDSIAVIGFMGDHASYLYGAGNPAKREGSAGTAVLWDAMSELARSGIKWMDFEGVNSPARGYFKMSFGGELTPYFRISVFPGFPGTGS